MSEPTNQNSERAFELVAEEQRIIRTARMLDEKTKLDENQRKEISERFVRFLKDYPAYNQRAVGQELGISPSSLSEIVRNQWKATNRDAHLIRINNWMELAARRENIVGNRDFVETSVAGEIISVAGIVSETMCIGVVFGPARIGKSMTLKAIEGNIAFGDPVLIEVDGSCKHPLPLCREVASRFPDIELRQHETYNTIFRKLVDRLKGTKRMLMFDEVDLATYSSLEMIRRLHDKTGCPILLSGKPTIYEKLGFRRMGDYAEVTDQLTGRVVLRRDLTERTRDKNNPQPLFSLEDIRKFIKKAKFQIRVTPDAEKWLQDRACGLGLGGIGTAIVCLYLAYKAAYTNGDEEITAEHLEDVDDLVMGREDAARVSELATKTRDIRRVV